MEIIIIILLGFVALLIVYAATDHSNILAREKQKLATNATSPLHTAIRNNSLADVHFLIGSGANVNTPDSDGVTPLTKAFCCGNREIIDALIKAGADPKAVDAKEIFKSIDENASRDIAHKVDALMRKSQQQSPYENGDIPSSTNSNGDQRLTTSRPPTKHEVSNDKKAGIPSIILTTQRKMFDVCSVSNPSDAQKMKSLVYLCLTGAAMLYEINQDALQVVREQIEGNEDPAARDYGMGYYAEFEESRLEMLKRISDELVSDVMELAKSLRMPVRRLANSPQQLEEILSRFPPDSQVTKSTTVSGLLAFNPMYSQLGPDAFTNMVQAALEPGRIPDYAAVFVTKGIFGVESQKKNLIEVSSLLNVFRNSLSNHLKSVMKLDLLEKDHTDSSFNDDIPF